MDKCFACFDDVEYILPCYHKVCGLCLHDLISDSVDGNITCLCYPEGCNKKCFTKFTKDEVIPINNNKISYIAYNGNLTMLESLIESGAYIHSCNERALRWACSNGHLAVVECLIKHGANIHAKNDESLCNASYNGHLDVVKCLVSHGADIHARDNYSIRNAVLNGHKSVVEYLKQQN